MTSDSLRSIGLLGELDLVFVHQLGAAFIDHAGQVGDPDVFTRHAQLDQQFQAGQCGGARARGDQLDLFDVFAHHLQAVEHGRTHHDGGAVLVVVEDRDLHALAQLALLMDFIKKQFIDILEWTEDGDGTLAWRYPMAGNEIQYGASLTVRESQMAVFVNEGKVADVFGPGMHKLTTQTLPVLTYLKNWDKLFQSPFKSDVYFFSTRQQIDRRWGTQQPVTIRDKDFGAVRLRAFGNYAYRIADPKLFHTAISGTRDATPWTTWTASCAA
jgi:hypothetical protein